VLWYCECVRDFLIIWSVCWAYFKIGWCNHWMGVVGYMIYVIDLKWVYPESLGGAFRGKTTLGEAIEKVAFGRGKEG